MSDAAPPDDPNRIVLRFGGRNLSIRRHLGKNWSGAVTVKVKVDHELVRCGPYERIRHPIDTGVIGM